MDGIDLGFDCVVTASSRGRVFSFSGISGLTCSSGFGGCGSGLTVSSGGFNGGPTC